MVVRTMPPPPDLYDFLPPADFRVLVQKAIARVSTEFLFSSHGINLRNAWVLSSYAIKRHEITGVRLVDSRLQFPDGELRTIKSIVPVEVTEILDPGRRRGDELAKRVRSFDEDELNHIIEALHPAIDDTLTKKSRKFYNPQPLLLIYLNMTIFPGHRTDEVRATIEAAKNRHRKAFIDIAVLFGESVL